jgi:hypothetical protein
MENFLAVVAAAVFLAFAAYNAFLLYACLTGHLDPACIHYISPPPVDMNHCS